MKNSFLRKVGFKLIIWSPSNDIRVFFYRNLFGYKIGRNSKIGKSVISAREVIIGANVEIGDQNLIYCRRMVIGEGAKINSKNVILGNGNFSVGKNSRILNEHHFDVRRNIRIGDNAWIAGKGSQFWTHGSLHTKNNTKKLDIFIGDNVYIGSQSLIAPGVTIGALNLIGIGSVVTTSICTSYNILLGNPAKVVKEGVDWREQW